MVATTGDIPSRDDVAPDGAGAAQLVQDILESGEIIVHLVNGQEYELHGHDTYIFDRDGIIYTKHQDDDVWFYASDVVSIERHYE